MKKYLLGLATLICLTVYAALPPTQLKGGNEAALSTTFNFNLGQIPVTRTGTNVTFGTIPVTQGGTSQTTLTQYGLMSGNGTSAVNMISPGASGTLLFSNGASAFPSYRLLASGDVTNALGYTPLASSTAAIISTLGYTPLASSSAAIISTLGYTPANQVDLLAVSSTATTALNTALSVSATVNTLSGTVLYKANNLSDVANAATARTNLGLGTVAVENTVPTTKGGTGQTNYATGDLLVGSGTTLAKTPKGGNNQAFVTRENVVGWKEIDTSGGFNLAIDNPSFESSTTGYTTSGTVTLFRQDRQSDGVNYSPSDIKYLEIATNTNNGGACRTDTIPQNLENSSFELNFRYRTTSFAASSTMVVYQKNGTNVTSQTVSLDTNSVGLSQPFIDYKAYRGVTSGTLTTCWLKSPTSLNSLDVDIDNVYVGAQKSLVNGAIVGPWQSFIPVWTGLSPTGVEAMWRRVGDSIELSVKFIAAGGAASELRMNYPNSLIASSKISSIKVVGKVGDLSPSINIVDSYVLAEPSVGYITFGYMQSNSTGALTKQNGNSGVINGATSFFATIPIEGWSASGVSFDGRCPNDISCTNDFSSFVGSTGIVTQENLDFVSSCTKNSTGDYSCTFNTGVFSVTPNCSVSAFTGSDVNVSMNTQSTTTINYKTFNTAGIAADGAVTLRCSKQGSDYVAKKTIQGYLSEMVREHIWLSAQGTTWSSTANTWTKIPLSLEKNSTGAAYSFSSNCITIRTAGTKMYKITLLAQALPANGETVNLGYSATSIASGAVQADSTFISASGGATDPNREMYTRIYFDNFTFGDSVCAYTQITTNTRSFGQGRMVLEQLN